MGKGWYKSASKTAAIVGLIVVIILATNYGALGQGFRSGLLQRKIERAFGAELKRLGVKHDRHDTTYRVTLRGNLKSEQDAIWIKKAMTSLLDNREFSHLAVSIYVGEKDTSGTQQWFNDWSQIPDNV